MLIDALKFIGITLLTAFSVATVLVLYESFKAGPLKLNAKVIVVVSIILGVLTAGYALHF